MTSRFRFVLIIALGFTAIATATADTATAGESQRKRPNIIFVLLDNAGKDWFRCYGSQENQTPNIDQLCYTGLKFRHFYVTPVCSTSRTMILTGRYPFRTGWHTHHDTAIYGGGYLDWNREVTFARLLRDAGYATCIVGKWQINDLFDPAQTDALTKHGFQKQCIWPEGKPGHPAHLKRYWDAWILRDGEHIDTKGKFGPDVFNDYAIDFMRQNRDRPFLIYYSAILTHIPVTTTPLSKNEKASPREKFAGMVHYADHLIGKLVQALDKLGLRDDTLLFIATDNGTDNGTDQGMEQSLGGRIDGRISGEGIYSLTERGVNVPFIVNCPGWIKQGRESDALLNAADVLPTLADLAGAIIPLEIVIDGRSFASVIRDGSDKGWTRPWTFTQYSTRRVVRGQRFKLFSTGEFYDLAEDPLELRNLADSPTPLAGEALTGRKRLQEVLDALPPDTEWPWTFRSISARKLRAKQDAPRRAKWIKQNRKPPKKLAKFFEPPAKYQGKFGDFRSPLLLSDGSQVKSAKDWQRRRNEIRNTWQKIMGPWPPLIEKPKVETVKITRRGNITQRHVRIGIALDEQMVDGFLLIPDGDGPFPAVLVVYYDAQTGAGLGTDLRDFGWQLARRGFVTLSIGMPSAGVNLDNPQKIPGNRAPYYGPVGKPVKVQPLSALAYAAANAHTVLARRPEVYPDRIGIIGHSFGGKWAIFASSLHDKFDCAVWSDPGIVFDDRDRRKLKLGGNINYWDKWYLGYSLGKLAVKEERYQFRGVPSKNQPRTGSYKKLIEDGHDLLELHALMAPRPFLVSGGTADRENAWLALNHTIAVNRLLGYDNRVAMTNRDTHAPTEESNEQVYRFFEWWLGEG